MEPPAASPPGNRPAPPPSAAPPASGVRQDLLLILLLGLLTLAFLPSPATEQGFLLGSDKVSDTRAQFFAFRQFFLQEIQAGRLPTWNPFLLSGQPYLANIQNALFYPLTWLLAVLPLWVGLFLLTFLQIWWTGAGMFVLARVMDLSRPAATIAATSFMFSSVVILRVLTGHQSDIQTLCWMPVLFVCLYRSVIQGRPAFVFGAALTFALMAVAGHPQHLFFFCVGGLFFLLCRFLVVDRNRVFLARLGKAVGLTVVLGTCLAAPQLLTTMELAACSSRAAVSVADQNAFNGTFSFPPENLSTLVVPGLFGDGVPLPYWGRGYYLWEMCLYLGIPALVLLVFAPCSPNRGVVFPLFMTAFLCLLLALGKYQPFFPHLVSLPLFKMFRGYSKFITEAAFLFALLAGFGADAFARLAMTVRRRAAAGLLLLLLTGSVVLLSLQAWTPSEWSAFRHTLETRWEQEFAENFRIPGVPEGSFQAFQAGIRRSFLLFLLTCAILAFQTWRAPGHPVLPWLLVGALVTDLFLFGSRYTGLSFPADRIAVPPEVGKALTTWPGRHRTFYLPNEHDTNDTLPSRIEGFSGYDTMIVRWFSELVSASQEMPKSRNPVTFSASLPPIIFRLFNVKHLVGSRNFANPYPFFTPVGTFGDFSAWEFPNPLPRAYLVPRAVFLHDEDEGLARLLAPGFDPTAEVVIYGDPPPVMASASPSLKAGTGTCELVEWSPSRLVVSARTEGPAWLVLSEIFYPGWRAFSGDGERKIWRANHAFRAVFLEPGDHRVEFTFFPTHLATGIGISCATILFMAGWWFWRRPQGPPETGNATA
ncbi:MAG: hypothetical protein GX442_11720 [Candidatus Riflebacteria bacterium]|nr:hypothetical protein [Candidatus Riflebacteria bacterium]